MEILLAVIIFVLGLCCGSFVNMLIYRTAVQYDLISNFQFSKSNKNRSFCDGCGRQLRWYENIPVISWIIQKGKTGCCSKKLPVLYPIVEIITGVLFLIFNFQNPIFNEFINFQFSIQFIIGLVIIIFLIFSAVFDLKYMILPDFSTGILVISALVFWCSGHFGDWNYILSGVLAWFFIYFLYLITKKKGMGFGDVKLAIFMGLFLGYPKIVVAMYIAFVLGALFGLILMFFKKANKKTKISFGPFLILGTLVAWFFGESIWYLVLGI